jgi:hypothetical protein
MAYNPKNAEFEKAIIKRAKSQRHASLDYKPPRHFRVFRSFLIGSVAAAMAAVLYTIYWFVIATSLKDGIGHWIVERAAQGVMASYKNIEISGFPFNFKVTLTGPKLQVSNVSPASRLDLGGKKWLWQGGRAEANMTPWNFSKFDVDLSGSHVVSFEDKGGTFQFTGAAQRILLQAEIFLDGWPEKFQLDVAGLKMSETSTKATIAATSAAVTSQRLFPGVDPGSIGAKTPTYTLQAKLQGVRLPSFLNLPLGHDVQELSTELRVIGALEPSLNVQNLARWRDAGGILEVGLLEASYGTLKTHATGTVALDGNLQPLAAVSAKFQGFFPAINKLQKAGYIRSGDAVMAKVVLGVLSKRVGKGQRSISLPLSLQDGQLSAGPAALMAVPAIDWGEDPPRPAAPIKP